MPNIKISDLAPATLPLDDPNTFLEVQVFEAGEEVSRKVTAADLTTSFGLDASFVTVTANAQLPNERILTGGAAINITDSGAGLPVTVDFDATEDITFSGNIVFSNIQGVQFDPSCEIDMRSPADDTTYFIQYSAGNVNWGLAGTDFNSIYFNFGSSFTHFRFGDPILLDERAAAVADVTGFGQFWVRDDTPNTPMFTDDAGTDFVLTDVGYFQLTATNRVIGSDAGSSNTGDNVILGGAGAGDVNTADSVIALGVDALNVAAQTDFVGSIAIGEGAGRLIDDTRDPWLIIGFNAAAAVPGASFHDGNTIIGTEALLNSDQSNIQGATLLGHRAGWRLGTGSNVAGATIIGREAAGDGTVQANLICQGVVIGNRACGNLAGNGIQQAVVIGDGAGDALNGDIRVVIVGDGSCSNSSDNDNTTVVGYGSKAGATSAQNSVVVGGQAALSDIEDQNVLVGAFAANTTGVAAIDRCVFIGQSAGNDLPSVSALFEISSPQGTTSGSIRPFLWGDLDDSNLALLNINDTSTGTEAGTRNLPTWGSAQGVFTMSGSGTDLGATTDADMVHHWIRNSDSALMLRYPGGDDVSILHNGTDSIIGNSAGAMAFSANSVEGLRLTEDNSGVLQTPSASVAVTAFAGGGQGSATALIHSYNVITTVATAGDSVRLPDVFAVNTLVYVKNDDAAEAADVFPASGDDLGAGVDTAVSLDPGASLTFIATVANSTWTQLISATGAEVAGEFDNLLLSQTPDTHQASPTLRFGDGDTGFYETVDDLLRVSTAGTSRFFWQNEVFGADNATGPALLNEASGFANPNILPRRNDADTGIGGSGGNQVSIICGGIGGTIWQEINNGMTVQNAVVENITASTTQTQGQETLVSSYNEVGTVANDNDVVTLPTARAGQHCLIVNNGANTLQIFPLTGDDLGQGVNNSTTLAAGESAYFWCWDITTWKQIATSVDVGETFIDVTKTADESVSSSVTLQDDDALVVTMAADTRYMFEAYIPFTENGGDILMDWAFTNAPQNSQASYNMIGTTADEPHDQHVANLTTNVSFNPTTTNQEYGIHIQGFVRSNATTGGTMQFRWAQNISDVNATIVREGAWMRLHVVT